MEVNEAMVTRLAELARLEFEAGELKQIAADLKNMIDFVDQLNEVDTEGVEPLIFISDESNVWREDIAAESITHEEALSNAPKKDSDYFRVPKVMSRD